VRVPVSHLNNTIHQVSPSSLGMPEHTRPLHAPSGMTTRFLDSASKDILQHRVM